MKATQPRTTGKIIAAALVIAGGIQVAHAEEGTKIGGFVDAGVVVSGPSAADAISVRDGAIYFNHMAGQSQFLFDLPFSLKTSSNDFNLAKNKAQAFIKHSYSGGIGWRLGQFDGIFGLERNDTVDLAFVTQGALFSSQAATHTAVEGSYKITDSLGVQVYVGGASSQGGANSGSRPEYGAKLTLSGDVKVGLGGSFRKVATSTNLLYVNGTVETKVADFNLGAEGTYTKAGTADAAIGGGLSAIREIMGSVDGAVRAQYLSKFTNAKELQVTAGVRVRMEKNLNFKANYVLDNATAVTGGTAVTDHSAQFAAVYGF